MSKFYVVSLYSGCAFVEYLASTKEQYHVTTLENADLYTMVLFAETEAAKFKVDCPQYNTLVNTVTVELNDE